VTGHAGEPHRPASQRILLAVTARAGVSPAMVGRVGPLVRLTGLVEVAEVASDDEPVVGLVSGEPGIGKTRLIGELVRASAGPGVDDVSVRTRVVPTSMACLPLTPPNITEPSSC